MRLFNTCGYRSTLVLFFMILILSGLCMSAEAAKADPSSSGPWLVYDFSIGWGMGGGEKPGGVLFEVQISDGGPYKTAYRAAYSTLRWYPYAIDLSSYAGKHINVRLITQHIEGRIHMDYPYWGNPRIVVGPLDGKSSPKVITSLALTKADRVGGILTNGTEISLDEPDPVFNVPFPGVLLNPAMTNREHMVTVYGGDNFITVPGKSEPGLYMGVSMGVDYLRIGAGPNREEYTGPMPARAFAQWGINIPQAPKSAAKPAVKPVVIKPQAAATGAFVELASREDKYQWRPGLISVWDRQKLTLTANMGPTAKYGWAFAGVETTWLNKPTLEVIKSGTINRNAENAFTGIVVDYHTAGGYQKRVFFGLGAGNKDRYDLRPGGWIYDDASMSLLQRLTFTTDFVDLSGKLSGSKGQIKLPVVKYAPSDWDGRMWLAAGVQNQDKNSGIQLRLLGAKPYIPNPTISKITDLAKLADSFKVIQENRLTLAISKTNGALCGIWDSVTGLRLAEECSDAYTQERMTSIASSTERYDKVLEIQKNKTSKDKELSITCSNPAFDGVTISKTYQVKPGGLFTKKVSFSTSDKVGFFIRYICNTALASEFTKLTPSGGKIVKRKVVAQGKVVDADETVAPEQAGAGAAPIVITTDSKVGIAGYRYHVNDRFVLRGQSTPTRAGWNLKVFTDYLKQGQTVSGESQWIVFTGDISTFNRHYRDLPENKKIYDTPKPEWVNRILSDAMCLQNGQEAFHKACEPYLVTDTIWFFNSPWGNWGSYHDSPNKMHPDVYGIAPGFRAGSPNARIGKYTNFAFDKTSDVYKQHPEYGVRDRQLELLSSGINSDSSRGASFFFQILNPVVRKALIKMHTEQVRDWNFDFFYTDGPGYGQEEPDWGVKDVTQNYDWLAYGVELKAALQDVNPDCAWFVNGMLPNADIGYIENRDEQWKALGTSEWQNVARDLFNNKFNEPKGFLTIPTYGGATADPEMSAYVFMYGWCGHGSDIHRLPWMRAAMDFRGIRLIDDAVDPKWYKTGGNLEAYGFRKGPFGIVNLMDHEGKARKPKITIDTAKLGVKGKIYAWTLLMNAPYEESPDPADSTKKVLKWETVACKPDVLFWGKNIPAKLKLDMQTRPKLTSSVIFSPIPVVLESVDGFHSETGLPSHPDLDIKVKEIKDGMILSITCRAGNASLLVPGWDTHSSYISTSQQISDTKWCGMDAIRLSVARGKHTIKITRVTPLNQTQVYSMDFQNPDQKTWGDTFCPVPDSVRITQFGTNKVLRLDSNSQWTYTRESFGISRVSGINRLLIFDFKARVLRADGNNSPAPMNLNLGTSAGLTGITFEFKPDASPEFPGQIVCAGKPIGKYVIAPLTPINDADAKWINVRIVLDRKSNWIKTFVDGKASTKWALTTPLGYWTTAQIMVCVPNGSGYGSIEYDDFKITTAESLQ